MVGWLISLGFDAFDALISQEKEDAKFYYCFAVAFFVFIFVLDLMLFASVFQNFDPHLDTYIIDPSFDRMA